MVVLAVLGLHCHTQAFSSCGERGLLFIAACGVSHCGGFSLRSTGSRRTGFRSCSTWAQQLRLMGLQSAGSVAVGHELNCPVTCGIFLDQGLNWCPCIGRQILGHCTKKEALESIYWPPFSSHLCAPLRPWFPSTSCRSCGPFGAGHRSLPNLIVAFFSKTHTEQMKQITIDNLDINMSFNHGLPFF